MTPSDGTSDLIGTCDMSAEGPGPHDNAQAQRLHGRPETAGLSSTVRYSRTNHRGVA